MSELLLPAGEPLVDVERSGVVESVHRGHVVIMDASGATVFSLGEPSAPIFTRSCVKPLQAVGLLDCHVTLTRPQLALAAASHSGEPFHVEVARSTLADAGILESELGCPPDLPLGVPAAHAVLAAGGGPEPIYMNCSGKHAAMLSTCAHRGWTRSDYLAPGHPLQTALASTVADLAGEPIAATGVDGCGAPLFAFSLIGLARAFLTVASAPSGSARLVADAMRSHPELVAGTGRLTTALMTAVPGLVAKEGAEGVYVAALPGIGAVALKIDDGASRAADVAVVGALRRLGITAAALDRPNAIPVLDSLPVRDAIPVLDSLPVLGGGRPVGSVRLRPGVL